MKLKGRKSRFHTLAKGIRVALQSNVSEGMNPEECLKDGIDPDPDSILINRERRQIFHPAAESENGEVSFQMVTNGREKRMCLVFEAKQRTIAARFGEDEPFGFERTWPNHVSYQGWDYTSLAFPGLTGGFNPVYFKAQYRGKSVSVNFEIRVKEKDGKVVVTILKNPAMPPRHLRFP